MHAIVHQNAQSHRTWQTSCSVLFSFTPCASNFLRDAPLWPSSLTCHRQGLAHSQHLNPHNRSSHRHLWVGPETSSRWPELPFTETEHQALNNESAELSTQVVRSILARSSNSCLSQFFGSSVFGFTKTSLNFGGQHPSLEEFPSAQAIAASWNAGNVASSFAIFR
jgi:hypothetical protein